MAGKRLKRTGSPAVHKTSTHKTKVPSGGSHTSHKKSTPSHTNTATSSSEGPVSGSQGQYTGPVLAGTHITQHGWFHLHQPVNPYYAGKPHIYWASAKKHTGGTKAAAHHATHTPKTPSAHATKKTAVHKPPLGRNSRNYTAPAPAALAPIERHFRHSETIRQPHEPVPHIHNHTGIPHPHATTHAVNPLKGVPHIHLPNPHLTKGSTLP